MGHQEAGGQRGEVTKTGKQQRLLKAGRQMTRGDAMRATNEKRSWT